MKNQFVKQDSLTRDFPHNIFRISHDSKQGVINSGGSRGGSGGSFEPPLEPKLFHFHGEFQEKWVKLHKSNPPQLI